MKSTIFFCLLIFSYLLNKAQPNAEAEYIPFLNANKLWSEYHYGFHGGGPGSFYYKLGEDTFFNNKTYYTILNCSDSSSESCRHECYIREDTLNRKVYKLDLGEEILIYDYNLNLGDSDSIHKAIVQSVDSVFFNGIYRKRINFEDYYQESWIEGIGSTSDPFNPFLNFTGIYHYILLCAYENNTQIFQNIEQGFSDSCTYPYTGVYISEERLLNESNCNAFPNPTTGIINITVSFEVIEIYNSTGQLISKENYSKTPQQIDISKYPTGLYYIKIIDKKTTYSEKILKK